MLRVEAAYLIRAAMVPLLNRHFSRGVVRLPMESCSQLLREAPQVQPIWCPLIVSEAGYIDGWDFASQGIAVPVLFCFFSAQNNIVWLSNTLRKAGVL